MIFHPDEYRVNKQPMLNMLVRRKAETFDEVSGVISEFATTSMVPIIVLYVYYLEEFNSEEVEVRLEELKEFYRAEVV